jgi:hypothetical protein
VSEVHLLAPVKAMLVGDIDERSNLPGAFGYYIHRDSGDEPRGIIYSCPCGCGRLGSLAFRPLSEDDVKHKRASWEWDKNREEPTLSPSVHHVGHWHGYLRKGMWVQA